MKIKAVSMSLPAGIIAVMLLWGCATMNKTQKGAAVGTVTGGAMGAVVGNVAGNTALGAIIGAAVGGTTGAIIGHKMDKQAKEIEAAVPEARVERVGEGIVVEFNSEVLFGFDKSTLTNEAKSNLNKLVSVLTTFPDTDIELQGYTDSKGSEKYNRNLSVERASAVSGYLTAEGVSGSRVTIRGFGEEMPKYDNATESGRSQNRRVEFLISANDKMKDEAARDATN